MQNKFRLNAVTTMGSDLFEISYIFLHFVLWFGARGWWARAYVRHRIFTVNIGQLFAQNLLELTFRTSLMISIQYLLNVYHEFALINSGNWWETKVWIKTYSIIDDKWYKRWIWSSDGVCFIFGFQLQLSAFWAGLASQQCFIRDIHQKGTLQFTH